MRKLKRIHFSLLLLMVFTMHCKEESPLAIQTTDPASDLKLQKTGSYEVDFQLSQDGNGSTWTYTLTKNEMKDPGHFILSFDNCGEEGASIADIVSVTVNGVDWLDKIGDSEGNTGCDVPSVNFVKFDGLGAADKYIIEFTLDTIYAQVNTTGWIKSGNTCIAQTLPGPGCRGYVLTSSMESDAAMEGKDYSAINAYMKNFGFEYSEHPNCTGGYGGHIEGVHCATEVDPVLGKHVFRFDVHIDPVIDGDRCSSGTVDRQRNEMKSRTNNTTWANVQGNWDEWQILEWKFKLPKDFQPTSSFCHIHQLKAQDGPHNGSPVITITPRANSNGSNKRMQIIHSVDGASTGKGTVVNNIPLGDFEGEWVQVREEMHYTHQGYYSCKITRIRDGKVLIDFTDTNIDMWRSGSSYIRQKYGIYRSLAGGRLNREPVGQSPLLKNESIWITDFAVYEKNSNPSPGSPHD